LYDVVLLVVDFAVDFKMLTPASKQLHHQVIYGEDVAILSGDALLSDSFRHVAEKTKNVDPARILDVVVRLGRSVGPKGLAGGQVMDLECEGKAVEDVTLDDLKWIHTHKTATLLQVAVASGAIMGGATAEEVEACETFALNIGLAFQVADDILDVTASTEDLGKTAGKDEDTDKATYPRLLGLDGARDEAQRLIDEAKASLEPFGDRAAPLLITLLQERTKRASSSIRTMRIRTVSGFSVPVRDGV
jgi:geranylgeranyl diphosphate synthase type II